MSIECDARSLRDIFNVGVLFLLESRGVLKGNPIFFPGWQKNWGKFFFFTKMFQIFMSVYGKAWGRECFSGVSKRLFGMM